MFDPYHKWLGIPKDQRPPTYYQLLGVAHNEKDAEVIEEAAVRQTTHVRAYQVGAHSAECTRLLNEIAQARQTLLNAAKRREYDDKLAQQGKLPTAAETAITAEAPLAKNDFEEIAEREISAPMRRPGADRPPSIKKPGNAWMLPAAIGGGVAVVLLGCLAVFLLTRSPAPPIVEAPRPKPPPVLAPPEAPIEPPAKPAAKPPVEPTTVKPVQPPPVPPVQPPAAAPAGEIQLIGSADRDRSYRMFALLTPDGKNVLISQRNKITSRATSNWPIETEYALDNCRLLALSPDGARALLVRLATVFLWNPATGAEQQLTATPDATMSVGALSADGKWAATGSSFGSQKSSGEVFLWENASGKLKKRALPLNKGILAMAFSHDSSKLYTLPMQGGLVVYHINEDRTENLAIEPYFIAAFSPNGKYLAGRVNDGSAVVYQLEPFQRYFVYGPRGFISEAFAFTNDGRYLAVGALHIEKMPAPQAIVLDLSRRDPVAQTPPQAEGANFYGLSLAANGMLVSADQMGRLRLWRCPGLEPGEVIVAEAPKQPEPKPEIKPAVKPPEPVKAVRKPVPPEEERQGAEKLLRERFAKDLAKAVLPSDRANLAEKLLRLAEETKDNATDRYVLQKEALNLATLAVKANLAVKAIDELAREFEIDPVPMKLQAFTAIAKTVQSKAGAKELGDAAVVAARELALADDFPLALQMVGLAKAVAPKVLSTAYQTTIQKQESYLQEMAKEFERMQAAQETLKIDPTNAAANLTVGKYLSLRKGDWEQGLPLMAKGGDDALAELARTDVKNPQESKAQVELGDAWRAAADNVAEDIKPHLQHRALHWYRQALPQSTGLLQSKLAEQIKVLEAVPAPFQIKERMAELKRIKAHASTVTSLELSNDGKKIFSGSLDGFVRGWDVGTGKMSFAWPNTLPVHSFSFAPDGAHLAVCSDTRIRIYDLNKAAGKPRRDMGSVPGAFWSDKDVLYRIDNITLWSHRVANGSGGGTSFNGLNGARRTVASPDQQYVALLGGSEVILIQFRRPGGQIVTGQGQTVRNQEASAAAFSPDNRLLALADRDGPIRIYDVASRQELKVLTGQTSAVRCLAFVSPTRLLSGGDDKSVRLWDVAAGKELVRVVHAGPVAALAVSADGRYAFSGSADMTIRQWELPPDSKR